MDATKFALELRESYDKFSSLGEIDVYEYQGQKWYQVVSNEFNYPENTFVQRPVAQDTKNRSIDYQAIEQVFCDGN